MICKNCNEIIDDSSKFCMHCGQAVENEQPWNIIICNDEDLWNKDAFDKFPSIISHEYHRIYELMLDNKTYGAMMQIKDLLEVLIKLPVVVELSRLKAKEEKTKEDYMFIYSLLAKPLSLGDWRSAITHISKHKEHVFDDKFMKDLKDLYNRNNVFGKNSIDLVHWRNQTIGHGALAFDSDDKFKSEFQSLLLLVTSHFNKWNDLYSNMKICGENDIQFKGKDEATNLEYNNSKLFFQNNEGVKLVLDPFLLLWDKQFYIFDALIYDKEKYDVLCYPIGRKEHFKKTRLQKDIKDIFEESNNFLKRNKFINQSIETLTNAEDKAFAISYDDYLNADDEKIYEMQMIDDWLLQGLNQSENNIFLLMMERGMGKTSWVKNISQGKGFDYDIMFKTIYLNDTYRSNWESIVSKIDQTIITDNNHTLVIDDSRNKHIRMDAEDIKGEIVDFFKYYIDIYKKEQKGNKIVLILDGIDEIKLDNNNNILDWIPKPEMLPKDFYIVLTCRNSEEISRFLNICLSELTIPETNKLIIYREDEEYRQVLEKYINDNIKQRDIIAILNKAEYRFAYANILTKIIKHSKEENKKIALDSGVIEGFLDMIEAYYDKRYLPYLYDIIYTISTAPEAVTVKQLSYILGEEKISFRLLGFLNDLKGILKYERTDKKNRISIANEIYKDSIIEILMRRDGKLEKRFQTNIEDLISDMYTEFVSKEKNIIGEGQDFLLLHLNYYHNENMNKYIDYNLFKNIFNCAERYIKSFSYEDTKMGYEMLENTEILYSSIHLGYNDDELLEMFLNIHIRLVCEYKLLFRWKDLYINDNISERLSMAKAGAELQIDIINMIENLDSDPFIYSIVLETYNIYANILIEYGSYYYIKGKYDEAKKMLLQVNNEMKHFIIQDKDRYRKFTELLYKTSRALGEKDESIRYLEEYNNIAKEILIKDRNLIEEDNNIRILKINEELEKVEDVDRIKDIIYEEIEKIENQLKNLNIDRDSYKYYNICEYESVILGIGLQKIGDEYLKTDNYIELLEFTEEMNRVKNKIQGRNFIILPETKVYLAYYGGIANMRLGNYDDALLELNLMETGLGEIENSNKLIKASEINILYLKYILYIQLCRCSVFKNQDYRKAFNYFIKAADIYEERTKNSVITDVTRIDYLKSILGLYVATSRNAKEGNKDILDNLQGLFEEQNELFIENTKKNNWENDYIIIDRINDKFLSCAFGVHPKKFKLSNGYYEIDFKKTCNRCSYKDCIGYLKAGSFKLKK